MAGGLTGLAVTIGGLMFCWIWWSDIVSWLNPNSEGKEVWHLIIALGTVLGGQFLMFASAQVARGQERASPGLRRILYGYNAVLTCLTVLIIVGLLTVLVSSGVKAPLDFTASKDFSLSEKSIKILQALKT